LRAILFGTGQGGEDQDWALLRILLDASCRLPGPEDVGGEENPRLAHWFTSRYSRQAVSIFGYPQHRAPVSMRSLALIMYSLIQAGTAFTMTRTLRL
jgi:hypothetical protein